MFSDSRWQGSAGSSRGPATDDKIHSTSPTHTQLCHWLEWSLGHFSVHSSPSIRDALSVVHFFFLSLMPSLLI